MKDKILNGLIKWGIIFFSILAVINGGIIIYSNINTALNGFTLMHGKVLIDFLMMSVMQMFDLVSFVLCGLFVIRFFFKKSTITFDENNKISIDF
jgi:hypothetical protein